MVSKLRNSHSFSESASENAQADAPENPFQNYSFHVVRREKQPLNFGSDEKYSSAIEGRNSANLLVNEEAPATLFTPASVGSHASSFDGTSHALEKNSASPRKNTRRRKTEYESMTEGSSPIRSSWYDMRSASPTRTPATDAEGATLEHSSLAMTASIRAPRVTRRIARMLDTGLLDTPPQTASSSTAASVFVEERRFRPTALDSSEKSLYERVVLDAETPLSPRKTSLRKYNTRLSDQQPSAAHPNLSRVPKSPAVSLAKLSASKYRLDLDAMVQDVTDVAKKTPYFDFLAYARSIFATITNLNAVMTLREAAKQRFNSIRNRIHKTKHFIMAFTAKAKAATRSSAISLLFLFGVLILCIAVYLQKKPLAHAEMSKFSISKDALDILLDQHTQKLLQDVSFSTDKKISALKRDFEVFLHMQTDKQRNFDEKLDDFKSQIYSRLSDFRQDFDGTNSKISAQIDTQLKKLLQNLPRQSETAGDEMRAQWTSEIVAFKGSLESIKAKLDEAVSSTRALTKKTDGLLASEKSMQQKLATLDTRVNSVANSVDSSLKVLAKTPPSDASSSKSLEKDYASYADGAKVVFEHTTETYGPKSLLKSLFYFTPRGKPPLFALIPDLSLGNCWSFAGSAGILTIELSESIFPKKISIEHVSFDVARNPSSAPKDMEVYAIEDLKLTMSYRLLAKFSFDITDGSNTKIVLVKKDILRPVKFVQLRILSNNGHPKYTCLYKFKVHSSTAN